MKIFTLRIWMQKGSLRIFHKLILHDSLNINFMVFFRILKNGLTPLLREILDPPLAAIVNWKWNWFASVKLKQSYVNLASQIALMYNQECNNFNSAISVLDVTKLTNQNATAKFYNLPHAFAQTVHFIYNSNVIILGSGKYAFFSIDVQCYFNMCTHTFLLF